MSVSESETLRARRMKLELDQQQIQQLLATRRSEAGDAGASRLEDCLYRLIQYRRKGRHTQARFQVFAYNLYCSKPQIYRRLKTLLQLPDETLFQNYKVYLAPVFEDSILYFLSSKLNSLRSEVNHFVLCLDQYPINRNYVYDTKRDILLGLHNVNGVMMNQPASLAYVMMLRSLCTDWVQPVAYAFRSKSLNSYSQVFSWCSQVISKLLLIGIQLEAIVTRPEYLNHLRDSSNDSKNYFMSGNTKTYHIHDVRVLIECVRNCLIENDFYYIESRISWHYIRMLYNEPRDSDPEMIPDIKEVHINPSTGQAARWKPAREIFSPEVYVAIVRLIATGALPQEAQPTANFVRAMSELFDVIGCGPRSSEPVPVDSQIEVLERAAEMFRSIRMRSGSLVPAAIAHMRYALAAMATLLRRLKEKGFQTVDTSRLNNAPVNAFFESVPRTVKLDRRLKPTASQVYRAFAAAFGRSMRRRTGAARRERCGAAAACGLLDARRVPAAALPPRSAARLPRALNYRLPLPRVPGAVAAFLLYSCMRVHSCPELERWLTPRQPLFHKATPRSWDFWERLPDPPLPFRRLVQELDERLPKLLNENVFRSPGGAAVRGLCGEGGAAAGGEPCACFPRRVLRALLVRLRLRQALKRCNLRLRTLDARRKRPQLKFIVTVVSKHQCKKKTGKSPCRSATNESSKVAY